MFWSKNTSILNENGAPLRSIEVSDMTDFELFSDASDAGYGGYVISKVQNSDLSSQQGEDSALQQGGDLPDRRVNLQSAIHGVIETVS